MTELNANKQSLPCPTAGETNSPTELLITAALHTAHMALLMQEANLAGRVTSVELEAMSKALMALTVAAQNYVRAKDAQR